MLEELSVDDLRRELQKKEQTVTTLTGYLEQAAAKLKELQKQSGRAKPARAFDEAEVHRQMELVKNLQAAVDEWNNLKAPDTLQRMCDELDRLRDVIVDSFADKSPSPAGAIGSSHAAPGGLSTLGLLAPAREGTGEKGKGLEGWEALKAEMLKSEGTKAAAPEEEGHIDLKEELDVLVNRPAPVEEDSKDRAIWQDAVDSREKYIISLIRALRVVEGRRRGSPDWESLTEAPAELRAQVAQLASDLQQSLRNAEVELSIESARLSRQESLIAQQKRDLDKARKKQGHPQKAAGTDSTQGRWLKFLGKGNAPAE